MKFILIVLPIKSYANQLPNLGAIAIAETVRKLGHEVGVIDTIRYRYEIDDIIKEIRLAKPDLIGISGIITSYYYFEPLANTLKNNFPDTPIIVGGGITSAADIIEQYTKVDYLVKGEGERAITEVVSGVSREKEIEEGSIPGLFVRRNGVFVRPKIEQDYPDITDLPLPAYDFYDMDYYIASSTNNAYRFLRLYPEIYKKVGPALKFFPMTITRGCPYTCTFCYRLIRKHRHPSVLNAVMHLKAIKDKYSCSGINILDELIVADAKWFIEFCDLLAEKVPGLVIFSGAGRANLLTPEIIGHAKKAGFIRFGCGIESGSQIILDNLEKKTTVEQNYNAIKLVKGAGMMATCNFIFGTPGENKKTLRDTENFIKRLLDPRDYAVNLAMAYPGAPLFNYALDVNILKHEEVHDYLLSLSFGTYPLNFSEFKTRQELCRQVNLMQFRLKLKHMLKSGEYRQLLIAAVRYLIKELYYLSCYIAPKFMSKVWSGYENFKLNRFNERRKEEAASGLN